MKIEELFALDNMLSTYDHEKTFDQVLDDIETNSDDVTVWEPFENHEEKFVIETIVSIKDEASKLLEPYRKMLSDIRRLLDVSGIDHDLNADLNIHYVEDIDKLLEQ